MQPHKTPFDGLKIAQLSNLENYIYKKLELYKTLGLNRQANSPNSNKSQNAYKYLKHSPDFIQAIL